jgi:prefoldin beta subunit
MSDTNNVNQLQLLQQNLQSTLMQKQQFQAQIGEYESALKELNNTEKAYKIVGKIMITASKDELVKDLTDKKEIAELRLKNFSKQEESLQRNIDEVQQEVVKEMKESKKD